MIKISEADCKLIKGNLGERVAKIVIQAVYTVMDTANDFPSSYVTRSLIPAVNALVELSKEGKSKDFVPETKELLCLTEAEAILRSTRQRVAGLPVTREFSRLPFELPPPCVHFFHEICEYVVQTLLSIFNSDKYEIFYPYVTVDTVDGPKHTLFSIRMPEHRLYTVSIYTALSHESFHAFFKKNDQSIYDSQAVTDFIKNGYLVSQVTNQPIRTELIEELTVELLDFEFSYLGNYQNYLKDESPFFAEFLKESIKGDITVNDIANYVFRTFIVRIWDYIKTQPFYQAIPQPSNIADVSSHLRAILREHIENFKRELSTHHEEVSNLLLDNLVVEFQHDFELISYSLNHIFEFVSNILKEEKASLDELRKEYESGVIKKLAKDITAGKVCNEMIKYPHLLTLEVSRLVRHERLENIREKATSVALILSIWNAKNLKKQSAKK